MTNLKALLCLSLVVAVIEGFDHLEEDSHHDYIQVSPTVSDERALLTPEKFAAYGITGWWSDCEEIRYQFGSDYNCLGEFQEFAKDPIELDPTGETCYINPTRNVKDSVMWFGPFPGTSPDRGIYIHAVIFPQTQDQYFPKDCDSRGVCSCDTIEPLREGWRDNFGYCQARICPIVLPSFVSERDCNVNSMAKYSYGSRSKTKVCFLPAKVVKMDEVQAITTEEESDEVSTFVSNHTETNNDAAGVDDGNSTNASVQSTGDTNDTPRDPGIVGVSDNSSAWTFSVGFPLKILVAWSFCYVVW